MSYFVVLVILCSNCDRIGQDRPEDPVTKRDLMKADLGTGDNEENEEESVRFAFCRGSIPGRTITCGTNSLANSLLFTQESGRGRAEILRLFIPL
jgi:hypothetical protein